MREKVDLKYSIRSSRREGPCPKVKSSRPSVSGTSRIKRNGKLKKFATAAGAERIGDPLKKRSTIGVWKSRRNKSNSGKSKEPLNALAVLNERVFRGEGRLGLTKKECRVFKVRWRPSRTFLAQKRGIIWEGRPEKGMEKYGKNHGGSEKPPGENPWEPSFR